MRRRFFGALREALAPLSPLVPGLLGLPVEGPAEMDLELGILAQGRQGRFLLNFRCKASLGQRLGGAQALAQALESMAGSLGATEALASGPWAPSLWPHCEPREALAILLGHEALEARLWPGKSGLYSSEALAFRLGKNCAAFPSPIHNLQKKRRKILFLKMQNVAQELRQSSCHDNLPEFS